LDSYIGLLSFIRLQKLHLLDQICGKLDFFLTV